MSRAFNWDKDKRRHWEKTQRKKDAVKGPSPIKEDKPASDAQLKYLKSLLLAKGAMLAPDQFVGIRTASMAIDMLKAGSSLETVQRVLT